MGWNENLTNLVYVLSGLYPDQASAIRIAKMAGLSISMIAFQARALDNWFSILDQAEKQGKPLDLVSSARRDYPNNTALVQAEYGALTSVRGPVIGDDIPWKGAVSGDTAEKIIEAQSTLLPISFLEIGL